ncbi:excalibur calcium-binding domain-containing protein [Pseudarthrobacter sp. NamB4]|uniref:excalibur calcium-binding domain-containing protein n=1 Tax=Pseudarthrobacter sp. NamB4 TaxID=2576837 RepID=UPI0010FE76BA|nr:excalibur calcium-binding domain-containing protein [Pseudarthrobacter sp. NamB4]TLM70289.1 excalibur calcium-binding domain-containing protein [Pseudarthrobacter sp. NamB4]
MEDLGFKVEAKAAQQAVVPAPAAPAVPAPVAPAPAPAPAAPAAPASVYFGSCADAKAAGAAPLYSGQPGSRAGLDRDRDGAGCES